MALGFAVWGDVPTLRMLGGALLIMGSGLFIVLQEWSAARARAVPAR